MEPNSQRFFNLVRDLSNAKGASGFEDEVVQTAARYAADYADAKTDCIRNLYLRSKSGVNAGKPVVMLDAHTDEVSFMVQAVKPNGTLRFVPLGSWSDNSVPAHRVLVRTKSGAYIPGITTSRPPHFRGGSSAADGLSEMSIDVGATSREEAEQTFGVRPGEPVVPDVRCEYDEPHDVLMGKAFDCRLGVASALETMRTLHGKKLDVDVMCALAAQEEVGTRGAKVTANTVKPDIAIVFEGCPADDTFTEGYLVQTAIKKGPMLRFVDRAMITNPRFQRFSLDVAESLHIPVQAAVRTGGSTNGSQISLSNHGVPVIVIGVPVRYAHTHYGISSFRDCQNAVALAAAIIQRLNRETIDSF